MSQVKSITLYIYIYRMFRSDGRKFVEWLVTPK